MRKFPNNFLWGAATSAHQVEGDNFNNDWWEAEQKRLVPYKSSRACDSYNRYEEDFDLAKAMMNNANRFSIEWSRVESEEGKFSKEAIEHYRKVLQALRARGLEPFVTLHHFTNPVWFAKLGGWTNKKAPEYFERYTKYVAKHLGKEVRYWVTINEPTIVIPHGYLKGLWPPRKRGDYLGCFSSLQNMAKAHKKAYQVLHDARYNSSPSRLLYMSGGEDGVCSQVGIAHSVNYFEPQGGIIKPVNSLFACLLRYIKNEWFLNRIKTHQDFIGLNYYNRYKISLLHGQYQDGGNKSDFGWEIYPEGIYHLAQEICKKYKKPIYITENGISDADDDQRPEFIKNHLRWLHKAIEEGADVRGYFYWSLLDNFEWAEGFTQRFGLIDVNFETFTRKMRPSGKLYGEICKNNSIF